MGIGPVERRYGRHPCWRAGLPPRVGSKIYSTWAQSKLSEVEYKVIDLLRVKDVREAARQAIKSATVVCVQLGCAAHKYEVATLA